MIRRAHLRFWSGLLLLPILPTLAQAQQEPGKGGAITTSVSGPSLRGLEAIKHDKIWSAVIVATNVEKPKEAPTELREFVPRLKKIFGYNQFELAGSATEEIDELTENWLLPSPVFPLSVTARPMVSQEARGGYLLNLKVFQGKQHLVDTEVKLAPGSPLFIKGPLYGKGQIIIALKVLR
jgi:hypothetical protein